MTRENYISTCHYFVFFFFLILKTSRSDVLYRARILNIVAVEYNIRVLSVFLFVKLEFM